MIVTSGLTKQSGVLKGGFRPSNAWNFGGQTLVDGIGGATLTCTRAGNAWVTSPTTGLWTMIGANTPSYHVFPDGVTRLLVREARTNILANPDALNTGNGWTMVNITATLNAATDPAGGSAMTEITNSAGASNVGHATRRTPTDAVAQFWVAQVVAKQPTTNAARYAYITMANNGTPANSVTAIFDLQTGTVSTVTHGGTGTGEQAIIDPLLGPNAGMYRLILSGQPDSAGTVLRCDFGMTSDPANIASVMNASDRLWLFRANAAAGRVPQMPTHDTTIVNSEVIGVNPLTVPAVGTIICKGRTHMLDPTLDSTVRRMFTISDGTANEQYMVIRSASSATLQPQVNDGGVSQVSGIGRAITASQNVAVAFRYNTNDFAASVNAQAPLTDTAGTLPTTNRMFIGANGDGSALFWGSGIEQIRIYPRSIPDGSLPGLAS